MDMTPRKKKGKSMTVQIAEQVLVLPGKTKQKQKQTEPSKKLQNLINRVPVIPIKKLQDWSDKVFDLGRLEGFEDMLIGKWVRKAMSEAGYSQRHMERVLPDTAKQSYSRYQETESDNLSDYQDSVTESNNTEPNGASNTEQDEAPTGYYQIPLDQFKEEDIEIYDRTSLMRFLKAKCEEIRELKARIERLEE